MCDALPVSWWPPHTRGRIGLTDFEQNGTDGGISIFSLRHGWISLPLAASPCTANAAAKRFNPSLACIALIRSA